MPLHDRLPPIALQTVQASVEPRLSTAIHKAETALKDSSVVSESHRLCLSEGLYHVSNSVVFVHRAGTLAKGHLLSKLFSKAEPLPFEEEINVNLVYFSCLKHVNEMVLGDPRHAHQRTQSFHFALPHRHSANTRPCCSSAQAPSSLSTSLHALKHSTGSERVDALGRRAVEVIICMITRDFSVISNDVKGVSLSLSLSLSLPLSQKSLTHNIGSASALPITRRAAQSLVMTTSTWCKILCVVPAEGGGCPTAYRSRNSSCSSRTRKKASPAMSCVLLQLEGIRNWIWVSVATYSSLPLC